MLTNRALARYKSRSSTCEARPSVTGLLNVVSAATADDAHGCCHHKRDGGNVTHVHTMVYLSAVACQRWCALPQVPPGCVHPRALCYLGRA